MKKKNKKNIKKKKVCVVEYEGFDSKEEALKWLKEKEEEFDILREKMKKIFEGIDNLFCELERLF